LVTFQGESVYNTSCTLAALSALLDRVSIGELKVVGDAIDRCYGGGEVADDEWGDDGF